MDSDRLRSDRSGGGFSYSQIMLQFAFVGVWFYRSSFLMGSDRLRIDRSGSGFSYSLIMLQFALGSGRF